MPNSDARSYHRTTIYLTDEQRQWLSRIAGQARLDGLPLSSSDVIRLALARLQADLDDQQLRAALVEHVQAEAKLYPGRAKRGMPA